MSALPEKLDKVGQKGMFDAIGKKDIFKNLAESFCQDSWFRQLNQIFLNLNKTRRTSLDEKPLIVKFKAKNKKMWKIQRKVVHNFLNLHNSIEKNTKFINIFLIRHFTTHKFPYDTTCHSKNIKYKI